MYYYYLHPEVSPEDWGGGGGVLILRTTGLLCADLHTH